MNSENIGKLFACSVSVSEANSKRILCFPVVLEADNAEDAIALAVHMGQERSPPAIYQHCQAGVIEIPRDMIERAYLAATPSLVEDKAAHSEHDV